MDAVIFNDFFRTIGEMNTSIEATCKDIGAEVKRIETSE